MNVNDPKKRFGEYNYTILNKQNKELFIITDIHGNLRDFKYDLADILKENKTLRESFYYHIIL